MMSNGGLRMCVSVTFSSEHVPEPSPSPSNKNSFHATWMTLDNNSPFCVCSEYSFNSSQDFLCGRLIVW